jgi:DMSO/TMAO reductase YedYZ molybdopterin-dependent catalytic subunit
LENDVPDEKYQHGLPPEWESLPPDVVVSHDARRPQRLPPGQTRTRKWPVLDATGTPPVDRASWQLQVFGLVERSLQFNWEEFQRLPRVKVFGDFHCVTRWSRLGNLWEGVSTGQLLQQAGVLPKAHFVILHGCDNGWTTNVPLEDFLSPDAVLADSHDGVPLSAEHGGPLRAVIPRLYAWKSAKWLRGIELREEDEPGYWERAGYHDRGDPWTEERLRV